MDERAVGVELLRRVAGVVGKLLDEELVGVAQLVLGHGLPVEAPAGEMLNEVLEHLVGQPFAVGPRGVAEDTLELARVGCFDRPQSHLHRLADVLGHGPHVAPVGPVRDHEPVLLGEGGVGLVAARLGQGGGILLVVDVGEPLEEEQREDELLVVAGRHVPAEVRGGAPEVAFEFLLRDRGSHSSHPPSTIAFSSAASASRQRASAALKAAIASGSGGISSVDLGVT